MWYLDSIIADASKKLEPNVEAKMKTIQRLKDKCNHELFDYVYHIIKGLPIFDAVPHEELAPIKCDAYAAQDRQLGNNLFIRNDDFLGALICYTRAIANAELGSEQLSLAYSNRSHLLLEENYNYACLQDIQRALACKYPENLRQKLLQRRERAIELKDFEKHRLYHDYVPRIINKHKFMQSAASTITLLQNEKWGRHIVARKNIKIGDVLLVEAPYISKVDQEKISIHCHYCLELCYNMIPCENCPQALYCNENCKEQAYRYYHKYECALFPYGLNFEKPFLRLTLKSMLDYDNFLNDLADKDDITYKSNRYKEIHELEIDLSIKLPTEIFENVLEPIVYYHYLTKYTDILTVLNIKNKKRVLKGLLLRNYFIMETNAVSIEKVRGNLIHLSELVPVGVGLYPLYSMCRHSCFPNTFTSFYGNKLVVRALSHIKKGEHVTVTFRVSFLNKNEQISTIQERMYNASCHCDPWLENNVRTGAPIPAKFIKKVANACSSSVLDRNRINKVLMEGYKIYSDRKVPEIPTQNDINLRYVLSDLLLCFSNKALD